MPLWIPAFIFTMTIMVARFTQHLTRTTLLLVTLLLITLILAVFGWWQGAAVGPEVQVPMFYDDHYLYQRPWTQEQEAPGVPDPAPVAALYGPNRLTQSFVSAAASLILLELWLEGPAGTPVELSLATEGVVVGGEVVLEASGGRVYRLAVPEMGGGDDRGRVYTLTLSAPSATAAQPVITRAVGGDRLGSSLRVNEYRQPGNLALTTYGRGAGSSLGEQLLPAVFRLRLQQYKPTAFKGVAFPVLLGLTALATVAFFFFSLPDRGKSIIIYLVLGLWLMGLVWLMGRGRVLIPFFVQTIPLQNQAEPLALVPPPDGLPRLVQDFSQTLWTATRKPEPRFVSTGLVDGVSAILVPASSTLEYPLTLPLAGRLRLGMQVQGEGALTFTVLWGEQTIHTQVVKATDGSQWLDVDLSAWGGQGGLLFFRTTPGEGEPTGAWLMPQLLSPAPWLLADPLPSAVPLQPAGERFGVSVELVGYQVAEAEGQMVVTLYWRTAAANDTYATIFVHLLDSAGNILAQQDSPPVQGTYPLPVWTPGFIVADEHRLTLPADAPSGPYHLAIGLYDPVTLARWPVTTATGEPLPDGRALLEVGNNN